LYLTSYLYSQAATAGVHLPEDFMDRVSGSDGEELFTRMQNCCNISVFVSPLAAIVAKKYSNESIRRDFLLGVCLLILFL
jgi:hypothetical protein